MPRASLSLSLALSLALCPGLLGCDGGGDDDHAEHAEHDEHAEHEEEADCSMEERDDEFAVGLSKSGTATTVNGKPCAPTASMTGRSRSSSPTTTRN